ncbi:MAG: hypothetical protein M0R49_07080 [Limnochordia bacterium]|nr:hypothetical protein [Limnochordia bacterium]
MGTYFMYYFAYGCTSLAKLLLPKVGWFATHDITWGVPSGRLGILQGVVLDSADLAGWKALTAETKTLYLNYIRDADDVIFYIPSVTARYVDKDHPSAANSGAGTESAPWASINYAVDTASATQAGDIIYVKESSTPYNEQVIFDKSGTAGNPITLMAYPGDNPIIDCQGINLGNSISGSLQGAVHIHNKNHIVIDGFEICNSTCMGITVYEQCDNITLKDMYIHETGTCGVYVSCTWNSLTLRPSNILIDGVECYHTNSVHDRETITAVCVDGLEIKNCKIHDTIFDGELDWPCQNGINPQGCNNMIIHHNEVYNVMDGIYIGGSSLRPESGGVDVYNNYVHGCYWPTHNLGLGLTIGFETVQNGVLTDVDFYNNIVAGNYIGFMDDLMGTNNFYVTFRLVNNTFFDNKAMEIYTKKTAVYHNSCVIRNNIIYSKTNGVYGIRYDDYASGGVTIDHNLFYNSGGSWAANNRLGTDYVTGDPLFVDSTPESAAEFAIQSGSPAKDAGSSTSAPATDYVGTSRPQGESYDIGAYEYTAPTPDAYQVLSGGTRYRIDLRDQSGNIVAVLTDWTRLDIYKVVNGISTHILEIDGNSPNAEMFELDGQLEVWRRNINAGIPWTLEYEGFHRSHERRTLEDGNSLYVSHGVGYNHLLTRRIVCYYSSSVYTDKSGPGESVMKAYVDENAGPSATNPPRLLLSGVMPGLSIESDGEAGTTWTGTRPFIKLLDICQEVANATGVDFGIVGKGKGLFEFQAKLSPWGNDRSTSGLNPATGLNSAGNAPVVFSLAHGNMAAPEYSLNRDGEVNAVISMGTGLSSERILALKTSAVPMAESPWNQCEAARGANNEYTTNQLEAGSDAFLAENQAKESFNFGVMQTPGCLYGREYFFGDLVTARYKSIESNKKIIGVRIAVEGGKEDISLELCDV